MRMRSILIFSLMALVASCGQVERMNPFAQNESPPAAAPESMPTNETPGREVDGALPTDGPIAVPAPAADLDPANTEVLDSERVLCEEKGGMWSRAGGGYSCVFATRDANAFCTSASQCEGYCLARSQTCAPVTPLYGCHETISSAGGMQRVCLE